MQFEARLNEFNYLKVTPTTLEDKKEIIADVNNLSIKCNITIHSDYAIDYFLRDVDATAIQQTLLKQGYAIRLEIDKGIYMAYLTD